MPSQILTVAKIGGVSAELLRQRFLEWHNARRPREPSEFTPEDWPSKIRCRADAFADDLRKNAHAPPIIFYVEYVDLWSICPLQRHIGEDYFLQIMGNRYELALVDLPLAPAVYQGLCHVIESKRGDDEDRLFGVVALKAASAWENIVEKAVLVFLRQVIGEHVEDHDIETSLDQSPAWIVMNE